MIKIVEKLLKNENDDYILPFFWQRNEAEEIIREYMSQIYKCGIRQVCLESRPHPDFCGPKWWYDLDIVFDEADKLGMRVWVLDDCACPTGSANGKGKLMPERLKKTFLHLKEFDIAGPKENAHFILKSSEKIDDVLNYVSAIAVKVDIAEGDFVLTDTIIDFFDNIKDDKLWLNVGDGHWKIYVVYEKSGDPKNTLDTQINPIIAESTDVLINEVYEKHYNKYKERFGKSFAGFFADESGFYNIAGFKSMLGIDESIRLPWGLNMYSELEKEYGADWRKDLAFLWISSEKVSPSIRYAYMNTLTQLYEKNFSRRIGDWCTTHKVEYIGHVVEDENNHSRLATGAGHFFRSLSGHHMSGVDVVLNQLLPDLDYKINTYHKWDGEFFHYALAKLGSSLSILDCKKKNRALCEVFGAYGWSEGLKLMKWLADHMLVRGINYFVPHAFSMADFPDYDCPPHFYAHGKNQQFKHFGRLIGYINRMAYLLSNTEHNIKVAILYNAEAEWCGKSMLIQKPARELTQNQIDFLFLPADYIDTINTRLQVNGNEFDTLIVPYAEKLPYEIVEKLYGLSDNTRIIFINGFPDDIIGGNIDILNKLKAKTQIIKLNNLAEDLVEYCPVKLSNKQKHLRLLKRKTGESNLYYFFNESAVNSVCCKVIMNTDKTIYQYDAMNNTILKNSSNNCFELKLLPYESRVLIEGDFNMRVDDFVISKDEIMFLNGPFKLSVCAYNENKFKAIDDIVILEDMSAKEEFLDFSGTFCYETQFDFMKNNKRVFINLGQVYETAEVYINNNPVGVCISAPYALDITDFVNSGKNHLKIYVTNTLANACRDRFSADVLQDPSGLIGPIRLIS